LRFWDSSALVPLLVAEPTSPRAEELYNTDPEVLVWWGTEVECAGAIAWRERAGGPVDALRRALARLDDIAARWQEVAPVVRVHETARRAVRVHDLRAADAFQLAAALSAADGRPDSLEFVTLDTRLADAAHREGFPVLP
jgi:predicted nucleic acid-binding protein